MVLALDGSVTFDTLGPNDRSVMLPSVAKECPHIFKAPQPIFIVQKQRNHSKIPGSIHSKTPGNMLTSYVWLKLVSKMRIPLSAYRR